MGSELKTWKCGNGHVLGVVQRVQVTRQLPVTLGGNTGQEVRYHSSRLLLYRHAVDLTQETPAEVDVMATVEGTTLDVRCDAPGCDAVRSWYEGEAAMDALMAALIGPMASRPGAPDGRQGTDHLARPKLAPAAVQR